MGEGVFLILLREAPGSFTWEQLEVLSLVSKKVSKKAVALLNIRPFFHYALDKHLRFHKMVRLARATRGAFDPQYPIVYEAAKPDQVKIDGEVCGFPEGMTWTGGGTHLSVCESHIALCFYQPLPGSRGRSPVFVLWKRGKKVPLSHKRYAGGSLFPHIYGNRVYLFSGGSFQTEFVDLAKPTEFFHFRNLLGHSEENDPERPYLRGLYAVGSRYLTWYHIDARDPVDNERIRWTHYELHDFDEEKFGYKYERGCNGPYHFHGDFVVTHYRDTVTWTDYRAEGIKPIATRTFPDWIERMVLNSGVVVVRFSQNRGIKVWQPDLPVTGQKRKDREGESEAKRKKVKN